MASDPTPGTGAGGGRRRSAFFTAAQLAPPAAPAPPVPTTPSGGDPTSMDDLVDADVAATLASMHLDLTDIPRLATALHDARTTVTALASDNEFWQRKAHSDAAEAASLQATVARLESAVYKHQAAAEASARDASAAAARERALAARLEGEAGALDASREAWARREDELRELRRTVVHAAAALVSPDDAAHDVVVPEAEMGRPAPMSAADLTRDIKAASQALRAQEHVIADLRADLHTTTHALRGANEEILNLKDRVVDQSNELIQMEEINKSLMEENESFQMLLSERTVSGEFFLARPPQPLGSWSGPGFDSTPAEAGGSVSSSSPSAGVSTQSLADEMAGPINPAEFRALKQENKALQLYIQKILGRIMDRPDLQNLLSADYTPGAAAAAAADRSTRSAAAAGASGRARPASLMPAASSSSPDRAAPSARRPLSWIPAATRRVSMLLVPGRSSPPGGNSSSSSRATVASAIAEEDDHDDAGADQEQEHAMPPLFSSRHDSSAAGADFEWESDGAPPSLGDELHRTYNQHRASVLGDFGRPDTTGALSTVVFARIAIVIVVLSEGCLRVCQNQNVKEKAYPFSPSSSSAMGEGEVDRHRHKSAADHTSDSHSGK
ncbi:hypothetical protein BC828DRAFT_399578 [Blastocladiella britannica]|nr:hypothetical protein BC828DRAFT_399578 [Blastocladiella britannica]